MADFGKGTGGSGNGIGNQGVIAHYGAPLHLRGVANEFAREAAEHRVGVFDIRPLVHTTPDHFERHRSRRGRGAAAEQCIRNISIIEDWHIGRLVGRTSFSELHVDPSDWNFGGPEESDRRKCSGI